MTALDGTPYCSAHLMASDMHAGVGAILSAIRGLAGEFQDVRLEMRATCQNAEVRAHNYWACYNAQELKPLCKEETGGPIPGGAAPAVRSVLRLFCGFAEVLFRWYVHFGMQLDRLQATISMHKFKPALMHEILHLCVLQTHAVGYCF